jgi:NAD-dependent deacetylase
MDYDFEQAAEWVRSARELVVFTGAGISAESGIPTFRDNAGLWQEFPPEHFATWHGLLRTAVLRPREFTRFVHAVIEPIAKAAPSPAHRAIAEAEKHVRVTVITQNIDRLHQEAGSTIVHDIHGSLFEICTRGGRFRALVSRRDLQSTADSLRKASRGRCVLPRALFAMRHLIGIGLKGIYSPNLVMFGDAMAEPAWTKALDASRNCDCMIQIGCSGTVLPAASLPHEARASGARLISIDLDDAYGDISLTGRAAEIVPALFEKAFE